MLTKRGIILCLMSVALTIYLVIAVSASQGMAAEAPCRGVSINVTQNAMSQFVTPDDIDHELGGIVAAADTTAAASFNLRAMEQFLRSLSFVESVNCCRLANDVIAIDVVPMIPVARIFGPRGSYYINKEGKHLTASPRYQIDVPVIVSEKDSVSDIAGVISLVNSVNQNSQWSQLVSAYKIDREGDIYIVPTVNGHIVNLGDARNIDNKMERLFSFYNQVLDVKGWSYYDTISVKFANQVVAKVRPGKKQSVVIDAADFEFDEGDVDVEMITGLDSISVNDIKPKIQ